MTRSTDAAWPSSTPDTRLTGASGTELDRCGRYRRRCSRSCSTAGENEQLESSTVVVGRFTYAAELLRKDTRFTAPVAERSAPSPRSALVRPEVVSVSVGGSCLR